MRIAKIRNIIRGILADQYYEDDFEGENSPTFNELLQEYLKVIDSVKEIQKEIK